MKTRHRGPNAGVYKCSRYAVMPQNCCVPECKKNVYVENGVKISFHTFPEERKLFMKWIVAIRTDIGEHFQVTTHTRVSSRHFKPSDYLLSLTGRKRTLKPTAVPSVFHWKKRSPVKWKAPTRRSPIKRKKAKRKGNYESWFTNEQLHVRSIFGATGNSVSLVNHRKFGNTTVDQPGFEIIVQSRREESLLLKSFINQIPEFVDWV